MKIKEKDKQIINELLLDSRIPYVKLKEKLDIADTTIHYRIKKLTDEKVISKFTIELDLNKLGYKRKALIIFKIGRHLFEEISIERAKEYLEILKNEANIGFLALADDKKTIIALLVSKSEESFQKIIGKFEVNSDIESLRVYRLDRVEKHFFTKLE
ncbi:MAG: Lrp/AsnC family transcriptional regulator [Promethearchaeota archaeon]